MPAQDGTGPMGQGLRTGRGMGPCERGFGSGRGVRRGLGMGRGRQMFCRFAEPIVLTGEEQKKILEAEKEELELELKQVKEKLDEING
jgi:hypothetical protein